MGDFLAVLIPRSIIFIVFVEVLLLIAWGALLCASASEGILEGLVHPFFKPLCLVAGIILILLGFLKIITDSSLRRGGLSRSYSGADWLSIASACLPLLAVPFLSGDGYSLAVLENRGLSSHLQTSQMLQRKAPPSQLVLENGVLRMSVLDPWLIARSSLEREEFRTATVSLTGQFANKDSKGLGPVIFQLFVTCCLADASPVGVRLKFGKSGVPSYPDLSWLQVQGVLNFVEEEGFAPEIEVISAEIVPRPARAFIFR